MKSPRFLAILRLGRIEFAGSLFAVAVSGALSAGRASLADLSVLLGVAVLTDLWGFIHNDLCDLVTDRRSADLADRPLVSGAVSTRTAAWTIALAIAGSVMLVAGYEQDVWAVAILTAAIVAAWLYNRFSKTLPGSDVLFGASPALLVLLGARLADGGGGVGGPLVWVVVAIHFFDHVLFNAGATLKDVRNDRDLRLSTAATVLGVWVGQDNSLHMTRRFVVYIVLLRLLGAGVVLSCPWWAGLSPSAGRLAVLVVATAASLALTIRAVCLRVFDRGTIGRRWIQQDLAGKLLVPLLLAGVAGPAWAIFLVAVPIGWFFLCNVGLYGRGLSLRQEF